MRTLMLTLLLVLVATHAQAQALFGTIADDASAVVIQPGAEALPVLTVGGVQGSAWRGHPIVLSATLTAPVFRLDGQHERLLVAARTPIRAWGPWRVEAQGALGAQTFHSNVANGVAVLNAWTLLGGWFGSKGHAALETTLALTPSTYVAPTDFYRTHHWADAESGWVRGGGGQLQLGVRGGVRLRPRVDLVGRVAVDQTLTGMGHRTVPLSLVLGALWRL